MEAGTPKPSKTSLHIINRHGEDPDQYDKLAFHVIVDALRELQARPSDKHTREWFASRSQTAPGYGWCLSTGGINPNQIRKIIKKIEEGHFFSVPELHQMIRNPKCSVKYWERNAEIRARYEELKNAGAPFEHAVRFIADERGMGEALIKHILYNPRSFVMDKHPGPIVYSDKSDQQSEGG